MVSRTAEYPQPPFTQAIQLYGDRAGSQGSFRFAGLAWIQDTKVVLIQGDACSLNAPEEWRCLLRLTTLARRLEKPMIFWNVPSVHTAAQQRRESLNAAHTIQRLELELLRLPHPIITILNEPQHPINPATELIWNDWVLLVEPAEHRPVTHQKIRVVEQTADIASAILDLLRHADAIPATELIKNRQETVRTAAKNGTTFPSNSAPH